MAILPDLRNDLGLGTALAVADRVYVYENSLANLSCAAYVIPRTRVLGCEEWVKVEAYDVFGVASLSVIVGAKGPDQPWSEDGSAIQDRGISLGVRHERYVPSIEVLDGK
jgi:hypothetical protein